MKMPSTAALSEWEAAELVARKGMTIPQLAQFYRISARTVSRYRARTVSCVHCGQRFHTKGAAWDHLFESETT